MPRECDARPAATGTGGDVKAQRRQHRSENRPATLAAAWLVRRDHVRPLLAETVAWLAGLGGHPR
jgi:hypothetical protein